MNEENTQSEQSQESSKLSSVLIGILLVVAAFLAYNFFQAEPTSNTSTTDDETHQEDVANDTEQESVLDDIADEADVEITEEDLAEGEYLVKEGDTLWEIAESELNDGFRWVEIAEANGLEENPGELVAGTVLLLPSTEVVVDDSEDEIAVEETEDAEEEETTEPVEEEVLEETVEEPTVLESDQIYIVQSGDTLWSIAEQFYGDGNQWAEIFENPENNLSYYTAQDGHQYPMIHAGNILVVPATMGN